jgi:hypothetical protein
MKVDITPLTRIKLAALPDEDGRIARDIIRRLRSATTPIGNRIPGSAPMYSATLGPAGGVIDYEVTGNVATVVGVLSSAQRERQSHSSGNPQAI